MTVDLERVLHEVNLIRQHSLGLDSITEMPQGRPHSGHSCPLARAFEASGLAEGVLIRNDGSSRYFLRRRQDDRVYRETQVLYKEILLPSMLNVFIREFDSGLHPQLEERRG